MCIVLVLFCSSQTCFAVFLPSQTMVYLTDKDYMYLCVLKVLPSPFLLIISNTDHSPFCILDLWCTHLLLFPCQIPQVFLYHLTFAAFSFNSFSNSQACTLTGSLLMCTGWSLNFSAWYQDQCVQCYFSSLLQRR